MQNPVTYSISCLNALGFSVPIVWRKGTQQLSEVLPHWHMTTSICQCRRIPPNSLLSLTLTSKQLDKFQLHIVSGFYTTISVSWSLLGQTTDKISVEFLPSRIYMLYQFDLWK